MRIGLLADIHSNAPALRAVLSAAKRQKIELLAIAGDFVGYYYWPAQSLELLKEWSKHCVRGNHEDELGDAISSPGDHRVAGLGHQASLQASVSQLTSEQFSWLRNLPPVVRFSVDGTKFTLAHGTPQSVDEYVYPDASDELFDQVFAEDSDVIVLGHTHYQMVRAAGERMIINPGSVGQPRDRKPGAAWAVFDTQTRSYELRREAYDIAAVAHEAMRRDPDAPYLWKVLTRT
jgi:putative phosphoesterase